MFLSTFNVKNKKLHDYFAIDLQCHKKSFCYDLAFFIFIMIFGSYYNRKQSLVSLYLKIYFFVVFLNILPDCASFLLTHIKRIFLKSFNLVQLVLRPEQPELIFNLNIEPTPTDVVNSFNISFS